MYVLSSVVNKTGNRKTKTGTRKTKTGGRKTKTEAQDQDQEQDRKSKTWNSQEIDNVSTFLSF